VAEDHFTGILGAYHVTLKRESDEEVKYFTNPEDDDKGTFINMFKRYLQLDGEEGGVKVQDMYAEWSKKDAHFRDVASHIEGVRCVRQDPWECTISFICSQNNNIKRITSLL